MVLIQVIGRPRGATMPVPGTPPAYHRAPRAVDLLGLFTPVVHSGWRTGMNTTTTEPLVTADEFMRLHGGETCVELVKGRVVRYPMPGGPHGYICNNASAIITPFVRAQSLGRVFSNDTFTRVRPGEKTDTLRGPDLAFISYNRWP